MMCALQELVDVTILKGRQANAELLDHIRELWDENQRLKQQLADAAGDPEGGE